jgi:hypothetical protein
VIYTNNKIDHFLEEKKKFRSKSNNSCKFLMKNKLAEVSKSIVENIVVPGVSLKIGRMVVFCVYYVVYSGSHFK